MFLLNVASRQRRTGPFTRYGDITPRPYGNLNRMAINIPVHGLMIIPQVMASPNWFNPPTLTETWFQLVSYVLYGLLSCYKVYSTRVRYRYCHSVYIIINIQTILSGWWRSFRSIVRYIASSCNDTGLMRASVTQILRDNQVAGRVERRAATLCLTLKSWNGE